MYLKLPKYTPSASTSLDEQALRLPACQTNLFLADKVNANIMHHGLMLKKPKQNNYS